MKRKQNVSQFQLFSLNMNQYLPENHWSIILEQIFDHINFGGFKWKEGVSAGQNNSPITFNISTFYTLKNNSEVS